VIHRFWSETYGASSIYMSASSVEIMVRYTAHGKGGGTG
jgi:hypothetical protein